MNKILLIFYLLILLSCNKEKKNSEITDSHENTILANDHSDVLLLKDFWSVPFPEDYYQNNGGIIEVMESGGKTWTIRKLVQFFCIHSNFYEDEIIILYDNPRGSSMYKYKTERMQTYIQSLAITKEIDIVEWIVRKEEPWVKIMIDDDKSGWVYGGFLTVERGGPKYLTPENVESWFFPNDIKEWKEYYIKENIMR